MTLLENEQVLLKGTNFCKKKDFILLTMISCIHIFALAAICYLFVYKYVQLWVVYLIALVVYSLFCVFQLNKTYQNYQKFFGNDEIVITKEKIYYNVCMNKKGTYINYDDSILISDLIEVEVKNGLYPTRLTLIYKNKDSNNINVNSDGNAYMNVHCLENANEIYDYLSCLIKQK